MIGVVIKSLTVVALSLLFVFAGCDNGCDKENPSVILTNNGTEKADIQIKTSGGNTENINNIQPGASSEKRTFAPGEIEFTVNIQGVQDPVHCRLLLSRHRDQPDAAAALCHRPGQREANQGLPQATRGSQETRPPQVGQGTRSLQHP